jgi:hypothetical protein
MTQFGSLVKGGEPIVQINLPDHVRYVKMKETDPKTDEKIVKQLPLFVGDDSIKGEVEVRLNTLKKMEHLGIKIELIGLIGTPSPQQTSPMRRCCRAISCPWETTSNPPAHSTTIRFTRSALITSKSPMKASTGRTASFGDVLADADMF